MEQCFALALGVLSLVGLANGQQFTDATLGHSAYPGLSEQCYQALNTTLQMGRVVYPATFMIDRMIHAYDVSCAVDDESGMFCERDLSGQSRQWNHCRPLLPLRPGRWQYPAELAVCLRCWVCR